MGVTGWDAYAPIAIGKSASWAQAFSCMRKGGLRWVMIHKDWFASIEEANKVVDQIKMSPLQTDGTRYLYDLSSSLFNLWKMCIFLPEIRPYPIARRHKKKYHLIPISFLWCKASVLSIVLRSIIQSLNKLLGHVYISFWSMMEEIFGGQRGIGISPCNHCPFSSLCLLPVPKHTPKFRCDFSLDI